MCTVMSPSASSTAAVLFAQLVQLQAFKFEHTHQKLEQFNKLSTTLPYRWL